MLPLKLSAFLDLLYLGDRSEELSRLLLDIPGDLDWLRLRLLLGLARRLLRAGGVSRLLLRVSRRSSRLLSLRAMSLRTGDDDREIDELLRR